VRIGKAFAIGGAIAAASTGLGFWRDRSAPAAATQQRATQEDLASLRSEVATLRGQVAAQAWTVAQAASMATSKATAEPKPNEPKHEPETAEHAARPRAVERVASAFQRERRDPDWSERAAADIIRDLKSIDLGPAISRVDCASTMCKVELDITDPELGADLPDRVTTAPALQTHVVYDHHPDQNPPSVTLYVARPDRRLPAGP
jgi:hypothetical protein